MTSPQSVKKLTELFEQSAKTAGSGQPTGAAAKPIALSGLATGSVAKNRERFQQGTAGGASRGGHSSQQTADVETELRKQVIAKHLVRTGRANAPGATKGYGKHNLGGKRSADADARAEKGAGKVLADMESATQDNQRASKPGAPLAHAVSGHGPGTDQKGRLLHGRRNDEMIADKSEGRTPGTSVQLGPDAGGPSTPEYTTVGTDPSNVSGRFSSNLGMLHAVGEAFARADMNERSLPAGTAPERFVTGVSGRGGEDTGESFALPDTVAKQKEGAGVTPEEMRQRHAAITSTAVPNSKLVLDPATGVGGKRAGYTLQTAFPTAEAPDAAWSKPRHEGDLGDLRDLAKERDEKQKDLDASTKEVEKARKLVDKHRNTINAKNRALAGAKDPAAQKKIQDAIVEEKKKLAKAEEEQSEAEQAESLAGMGVMMAQADLDAR